MINQEKKRIHPLKFVMWMTCVSIVMMFAGLSSAFIVKSNQANWLSFNVPVIFWYSTSVIILSSITMMLSRKAFLNREMEQYRKYLGVTMVLGVVFVIMQLTGFTQLWSRGITLTRNVSFSFLYIIVGLHALHVLGGVIALIFIYFRSYSSRKKVYTSVPIDLINTYWHFVDLLWIYLLMFLVMIG